MPRRAQLTQDIISKIVPLKEAGHQTCEIAENTGISRRSVRAWVARYREGGSVVTLTHKFRSGWPKKISNRAKNIVKRELEKNPHISSRLIKENNKELSANVSVRSLRRCIQSLGYKSRWALWKPILTPYTEGVGSNLPRNT